MTASDENLTSTRINTYNEKSLHAQLKDWYAQPGDTFEVPVDGFIIDLVHEGLLVEIQTRNFNALKKKLPALLDRHHVRLVYPIEREKWLIKLPHKCEKTRRRKSPKRGAFEHVFLELVHLPTLLDHPNFSLEVLLIQAEEVRRYDGRRGWRRKGWVTHERRLLDVVDRRLFETTADLMGLVPADLDEPFTTAELAGAIGQPRWVAQKMAYCLRQLGALHPEGKRKNAILYTRTPV